MLLENDVAVITGGASGIGKATARLAADHGAAVVVADVDKQAGSKIVEAIEADGGTATFVATDVAVADEVAAMIERTVDEYGGLDLLFNNAGIEGPFERVVEFDEAALDRLIDVNLKGVFYGIKYGVPVMQADGGGSIVNTSSIAGQRGLPTRGAYSATKSGIVGLTRCAAMEYADDDIRVNSVHPGMVDTPMHRRAAASDTREAGDIAEALSPGYGQPQDVAEAVIFLGSDGAERITGHQLPVDGGYLTTP